MNKRILAIGVVVMALLAVLPAAVFAAEGTLTAQGDGRAVVRGSGEVSAITGTGKLVVKDFNLTDAVINVTCDGIVTEVTVNGNTRKYVCRGSYTGSISGANVKVKAVGTEIDLTATGTGIARLRGEGTYEFNGETGEWNEVEVTITIG
ncbi:MAG: hypothetical protein H7Y11_10380 [Armatimonadetes bacterium]|nr:hypothetical protein [Anaerolineae bacterium]